MEKIMPAKAIKKKNSQNFLKKNPSKPDTQKKIVPKCPKYSIMFL